MNINRYTDHGLFSPAKIAEVLMTTRDEIARTIGLGRDAVQRKDALLATARLAKFARHDRFQPVL